MIREGRGYVCTSIRLGAGLRHCSPLLWGNLHKPVIDLIALLGDKSPPASSKRLPDQTGQYSAAVTPPVGSCQHFRSFSPSPPRMRPHHWRALDSRFVHPQNLPARHKWLRSRVIPLPWPQSAHAEGFHAAGQHERVAICHFLHQLPVVQQAQQGDLIAQIKDIDGLSQLRLQRACAADA